jgi:hypothetical protein
VRSERRVLLIILLVAAVALPAGVIRAFCLGDSCATEETSRRRVPFCSLPRQLRDALSNGFREGRSPDVLGVTARNITIVDAPTGAHWPGVDDPSPVAAIILSGSGVPRAVLAEMALEDVAPTLANAIGFEIPHPEVRSGRPLTSIEPESARLILLFALKGLAADDAQRDPYLRKLANNGSATFDASISSLPLDPVALLTTIGTGGLPNEHGATGTYVRTDTGVVAKTWSIKTDEASRLFPDTIIATLADDLDEKNRQRSVIGLIGTQEIDRGLIGGSWYIDVDRDLVNIEPNNGQLIKRRASSFLRRFGTDPIPDILAVALDATQARDASRLLQTLYARARRVAGGAAMLALTTLPEHAQADAISNRVVETELEQELGVDVVERAVGGGFFLDQELLSRKGFAAEDVATAMRDLRVNQEPVFADAFTGFAVTLAEFC